MDLMRARVALRERALLDVLDLAVRFCGAHARAYGKLVFAVLVPAWFASWLLARWGGWLLGWTASLAIGSLADVPFLVLASRLLFDERAPTAAVLRQSLTVLPRVGLARVIELLAFSMSALFLGLPWLYLGPVCLFLVEVLVLERGRAPDAWGRAQRIATAHFGVLLATAILLGLLRIAGPMVVDVAGDELLERVLEIRAPPSLWSAGGSWLALVGWWAMIPVVATARFFVYIDCRTRSEGWDIQTRFAAIAARANLAGDEQRLQAGERS